MRISFLALLFLVSGAHGAASEWKTNPQGKVRLIAPYTAAPEQGAVYFGVHFAPEPGWMVYWKTGGDAGFPPKFNFKGSRGFKNPETLWPRPKYFVLPGDIKEYGYDDEVVYPVKAQAIPGTKTLLIVADINYLTCKESCIPYRYTVRLELAQAAVPQSDPAMEALLQRFLSQVPPAGEDVLAALHKQGPIRLHTETDEPGAVLGFWWIVLFGFLGGLLLNFMPCVLPVLSIKLFGLLEHSGRDRRVIIRDAMASAAGIVVSFLIGGAAIVFAKQAGNAVGWGVQFQNPLFVVALSVIVTLFALNLWGLFEISLPPAIGHLGAVAGHSEGVASYFVSGFLATLLATPCSAPFLGTAMGFALSQPPATILSVFLAAGLGMAFPYFVLAVFPGALNWLPRPGVWMVHVRVVLGFFLAATVVWLGYVLSSQVNSLGIAFFYLGLLATAMIAWLKQSLMTSRFRDSRPLRWTIWALLAGLLFGMLNVINTHRQAKSSSSSQASAALAWQPFDPAQIPRLVSSGKSVFVDVTADWCFTCKYNERFVLDSAPVVSAFQEKGIVLMKADWTNHDETIGAYLKGFNRFGIPFYAFYQPGKDPIVLPELLTQGKVLETLQR